MNPKVAVATIVLIMGIIVVSAYLSTEQRTAAPAVARQQTVTSTVTSLPNENAITVISLSRIVTVTVSAATFEVTSLFYQTTVTTYTVIFSTSSNSAPSTTSTVASSTVQTTTTMSSSHSASSTTSLSSTTSTSSSQSNTTTTTRHHHRH